MENQVTKILTKELYTEGEGGGGGEWTNFSGSFCQVICLLNQVAQLKLQKYFIAFEENLGDYFSPSVPYTAVFKHHILFFSLLNVQSEKGKSISSQKCFKIMTYDVQAKILPLLLLIL